MVAKFSLRIHQWHGRCTMSHCQLRTHRNFEKEKVFENWIRKFATIFRLSFRLLVDIRFLNSRKVCQWMTHLETSQKSRLKRMKRFRLGIQTFFIWSELAKFTNLSSTRERFGDFSLFSKHCKAHPINNGGRYTVSPACETLNSKCTTSSTFCGNHRISSISTNSLVESLYLKV